MNDLAEQLKDLRDIHGAPIPELWPPSPGWWLLAILILWFGYLALSRLWRWWKYRKQRKQILGLLESYYTDFRNRGSQQQFAREISELLRRAALYRFPKESVAQLSGDAWLQFLDSKAGHSRFSKGAGKILVDAPYRRQLAAVDTAALHALTRDWLRRNL